MSVLDSRVSYALAVIRTQSGVQILATNLGSSDIITINCLRKMSLDSLLRSIQNQHISVDVYNYRGEIPPNSPVACLPVQMPISIQGIGFRVKNIRDYRVITPILKTFFLNVQMNPIYLGGGFSYDAPFIYYNNQIVCYFMPRFEGTFTKAYLSVEGEYISYNFTKHVYLLQEEAQRHIAGVLQDSFVISTRTGKIVSTYKDVIGDKYCSYSFVFNKNSFSWQKQQLKTIKIDGYKEVQQR